MLEAINIRYLVSLHNNVDAYGSRTLAASIEP